MIQWYICSYASRFDSAVGELERFCMMQRYIPTVPNVDGADFDEVEIVGNHTLVKVNAPLALHSLIAVDPDFLFLPTGAAVIPQLVRTPIRDKLTALGYDLADIDATNWQVDALLNLLPKFVSEISLSLDKRSVIVGQRVRLLNAKTIAMMDTIVRG